MPSRTGKDQAQFAQIARPPADAYARLLLKKMRRQLPVLHCRAELGWPSDFKEFAEAIRQTDIQSGDEKKISSCIRLWQYRAAGDLNTDESLLALMTDAVPSTRAMINHPILSLLDDKPLDHDWLISVIYRLPPEVVTHLLIEHDFTSGMVEPKKDLSEDDLYTAQSLATLDAVAGLLALSRLLEAKHDVIPRRMAAMAAISAAKTFTWLTLKRQYEVLADGFWHLIRVRYLDRLAPGALLPWSDRQRQIKRIVGFFEWIGVIDSSWHKQVALLTVADRRNFEEIVAAVDSAAKSFPDREKARSSLRAPLTVLAVGYYCAYDSLQPESHTWNGREIRIRRADDLIANPDYEPPDDPSDPHQPPDHPNPVEVTDQDRRSRSSRPVPAVAGSGPK